MVQLHEIKTTKLSSKLSQAPELEPLSALSTDVSSDASSIHFSEKERKQERYIRARDQIIFCLNVINLIICSALLTKDPKYYVYWNAFIIPVLMIHRLYDFYLKGWQFYMIDFCYAVNLLVVVSTVFFPKNEIMSMISFGLSLGPLTFSIYYFRNSFAFTSIEKVTSLFIHGQAPITMFLTRWHDVSGNFAASAHGVSEFGIAFLAKWLGGIFSFYGIWAIVYCSMIFLVFGKHISRKKLQTLYNYSMSDPRTSTKLLARGAKWSKMLFMYNHFRMALGLSTVAMVFYFNYWIGLFWLIALIALAIYNGATYTIEYHSAKYEKQFIHTKRY